MKINSAYKFFITISLVILSMPTQAQNIKESKNEKENQKTVSYTVNDKEVSPAHFEKFLKSLVEIKGTWFCDETNTGGNTGYDAKDKAGTVYEYRTESDQHGSKNFIRNKPELK